jgi:hypothetical protein
MPGHDDRPPLTARARRTLAGSATLFAATAVGLGLLAALDHRHALQRTRTESSRAAAGVAAIRTFVDLTTVDYRNQADYVGHVGADTTGALHDQVVGDAADIFASVYAPDKQVLSGAVSTVGVDLTARTKAHAVVLGRVVVTSTTAPSDRTDTTGYAFDLVLVHGAWLVATATPIAGTDVTATAIAPRSTPSASAP